jgi:hypothetical protein
VFERPGRTLPGSLFTFDRRVVHAPVAHRRNIAPLGR